MLQANEAERVGTASRDELGDAGLARCEKCHAIVELGELDNADGVCGDCRPPDDDGQVQHQIERSAGGY